MSFTCCAVDSGTHLAERALQFLVQRSEAQGTDMTRPVVAFGDGPVLDGLGANPAKCAVVDRGGVGIGTVCDIFRGVSLPQLAVILS